MSEGWDVWMMWWWIEISRYSPSLIYSYLQHDSPSQFSSDPRDGYEFAKHYPHDIENFNHTQSETSLAPFRSLTSILFAYARWILWHSIQTWQPIEDLPTGRVWSNRENSESLWLAKQTRWTVVALWSTRSSRGSESDQRITAVSDGIRHALPLGGAVSMVRKSQIISNLKNGQKLLLGDSHGHKGGSAVPTEFRVF